MTKLFSMKTLAFAGAAAFALTLAAAPKADAAKMEADVNYETGLLTVTTGAVHVKGENGKFVLDETKSAGAANVIHTADGWGVYVGNGKDTTKAQKSLVVLPDSNTEENTITPAALYYDVSNLLGKETTIVVADNAAGDNHIPVKLVKSLTDKAKDIEKDVLDAKKIDGKIYQYKVGTYGEWTNYNKENLTASINRAKMLGTTLYVRIATADANGNMTSPWSKELKIKIKAKAKAPKIAVKTAKLTKAFEWNIAKYEYNIVVDGKSSGWNQGQKKGWKDLIEGAIKDGSELTKADVTGVVEGDAIAKDVIFQIRTPEKNGKAPSQISVVALGKSIDSPTKDQVKIELKTGKGKNPTVSQAAITAQSLSDGYMLQYADPKLQSSNKWKNVGSNGVTVQGNQKIQLRLIQDGRDKAKNSILPSAVTEVTIPTNGAAEKVTGITQIIKDGKWAKEEYTDYVAGTKKVAETPEA